MADEDNTPYSARSINSNDIPVLRISRTSPGVMIGVTVDIQKQNSKLSIDFMYVRKFELLPEPNHNSSYINAIRTFMQNPYVGFGSNRTKKMLLATDYPIYLAVYLSDATDWQYMKDQVPFQQPASGNTGEFFDAVKYKKNANNDPYIANNEDGVRLAIMKYYPPAGQYTDGFNINTECIMQQHGTQNRIQKIPIIIDPEVGWPTGTKP